MEDPRAQFEAWFKAATDCEPFPYQTKFATAGSLPQILQIPTGLGKTACVILGWLWRRRKASESIRNQTPRRLVYCLPMRVLVGQTRLAEEIHRIRRRKIVIFNSVRRVCESFEEIILGKSMKADGGSHA